MGDAAHLVRGCPVRHEAVQARGIPMRTIFRVSTITRLAADWSPECRFLVRTCDPEDYESFLKLKHVGNLCIVTSNKSLFDSHAGPCVFDRESALCLNDVVAVADSLRYAHVLQRESDNHHTVFLTNRCNSNCLMCSQPPTTKDDLWLVDEACEIARHIANSPPVIGFSGGEPLLLGPRLREVLDTFSSHHPKAELEVLTNGRLFSQRVLTDAVVSGLKGTSWLIPLYGHAPFLHDYIVQAHGAFDQTIGGLLNLQERHQPIQLRIVLIQPVLECLPALCEFIAKNLPFVCEVALMGCEPIGYARVNEALCRVDLLEWTNSIEAGITCLERSGIRPIIMNVPLCALPRSLHRYAHRSISEWKQIFSKECDQCLLRDRCSGLFTWAEAGWRPTTLRPYLEGV